MFEDDKPCVLPPAPPFWIIKLTGITKTQALKYTEPVMEDVVENGVAIQKIVKRRRYAFPIGLLPKNIKEILEKERYFETTFSTAKSFIQNKVTLTTE